MAIVIPFGAIGPEEIGEFSYLVSLDCDPPFDEVYQKEFAFRADSDAEAIYRVNTNQITDDLELEANLESEDIEQGSEEFLRTMRQRPLYQRHLYRNDGFQINKVEVSNVTEQTG